MPYGTHVSPPAGRLTDMALRSDAAQRGRASAADDAVKAPSPKLLAAAGKANDHSAGPLLDRRQ